MNLEDIFFIIAIIFFSVAIFFMVSLGLQMMTYGYNLTKEDIREGNMLQLCVNAAWYIENCWEIYGGIDTKYGEPIK